eukprot:g2039.t1
MIIYKDLLTGTCFFKTYYVFFLLGDELLSDSYAITEVEDGFFYEVQGSWITVGDADVDIGANPSAEGADEDEGVDSSARRVVDLIDASRLVEQPPYDKKGFMAYVKPWLAKVLERLPEDKKDEFKAKSQPAIKFLLGKLKDLQFFTGESMDVEGTMCYAYYKEGASDPTFLFPVYSLEEMKC